MKKIFCLAIGTCLSFLVGAQSNLTDTVVVQLAKSSQIIFTMEDRGDLELLHHYDFQALFEDILTRLEENDPLKVDSIPANEDSEEREQERDDEDVQDATDSEMDEDGNDGADEVDEYEYDDHNEKRNRFFGTGSMDLGIGNYLEDFKFPDANGAQYAVRPWGSWYVAMNSIYNTRISNSFKFEWGLGISWYNFKFQDDRTVLIEETSSVIFIRDQSDYNFIKSKLTVAHINVSVVPVVEFGRYWEHASSWKSHHRVFRVGVGLYGGYRIGSYTKQVHEINDDKEKIRNHDNFYLQNLRYGVRLQFGIHDSDFFVNYDLNELFVDGRGPKLNAYSFGIIF